MTNSTWNLGSHGEESAESLSGSFFCSLYPEILTFCVFDNILMTMVKVDILECILEGKANDSIKENMISLSCPT